MEIIKRDGSREAFDFNKIERLNNYATRGLNVDKALLKSQIKLLVYDGMSTREIFQAQISAAAGLISVEHPDFTFVAARYLLADTLKRVTGSSRYPSISSTVVRGIEAGSYNPDLGSGGKFDHAALDAAIKPERDFQFDYLGLQTVVDRYLTRDTNGALIELPQHFFMRVAMGLSLNEDNPTARAIEFYDALSSFDGMSSTPTLFNSATLHSQLSSCYLNTVNDQISADEDDVHRFASIYGTIEESARLSKFAGGIGTDWTRVRGSGSHIKSTNGQSSGVVPYLKVYNDTAVAVNQGGKRKGSFAPYLEVWHPDFWDFCELKKEFGDDRLRAHDIFPAAWISDLFMERVRDKGIWSEFQPNLYPELHELYGEEFKQRYEQLEREGKAFKQRPAVEVWKRILTNLFETGQPWVTFKDECNRRSPQDHVGVVHSSNLCCITADQRVVTDRGMLTVGELFKLGGENTVMGLTGPSTAGVMLLPRPDAPIVRIETAEGYTHKVTPDHRVWRKGDGWVEAQHLVPGDKLLIQQGEGLFGDSHNVELALIAGLVAGDGTYMKDSVCVDLWEGKTLKWARAAERAVEIVLTGNTDLATTSTNQPKFSVSTDGKKARLTSAPLARTPAAAGMTRESKLEVPGFIWSGDKPTVSAYLRGLYLTDGNLQTGTDACAMVLASVSKAFLQQVQILWANFGVKTSLSKMRDAETRDFGGERGGEYECQEVWRLLITSIQGCKIAQRVTRLGDFRVGETAETFKHRVGKKGYAQKLYATFTGLTSLPNEDAYCLTVDSETHAWTVNGMITHNTEITLNTSDTETAVCNLASVNLARHIKDGKIDTQKLAKTVKTLMRMLDNVIDLNYYPSSRAKASNMKHRPVGLGIMGETEASVACGIAFDSEEGVQFSDEAMELVSYYAINASMELAKERGAYQTFPGSKWSRGILPIHTARSKESRLGEYVWDSLAQQVAVYGMRNSNTMAIAPTATISTIAGTTPCNEPIFEISRGEKNMSGVFQVVDPCVRYGRPDLLKTAFEIDPIWVIRKGARRQKWLDQSQSLNIFVKAGTKGSQLAEIYMAAWEQGLKTTYYLRSQSKTKAAAPEVKQAVEAQGDLDKVVMSVNFCSIESPDCQACQ